MVLQELQKLTMTLDELIQMYKNNVDTGFFRMDVGTYHSATAGNIPREMGRRVVDTAVKLADKRELFGRYTHFYSAYKEEARALWEGGMFLVFQNVFERTLVHL